MTKPVAVITGIRGQDGILLGQLLIAAGFQVVGTSHAWSGTIALCEQSVEVVKVDIDDQAEIDDFIRLHRPDHLYCLAARASSKDLNANPIEMTEINGLSCVRFLEAVRTFSPKTRLCFASSSEVFAGSQVSPQTELTPTSPVNAYGVAKNLAMQYVRIYREQFGIYACSAILYNHESHLRPLHFVSKKICAAAAKIAQGLHVELTLGDLTAQRDWGYAGDTVRALKLMLEHDKPEDYVVATGVLHSVAQMCEIAFSHVGLQYTEHVKIALQNDRRAEASPLRGDASKARQLLNWMPEISFEEMIQRMVDHEMKINA